MGRSHSKAHSRVTKVAPLQNKGADTPSAVPMDFAFNQNLEEKSSYSLARLQDRNEILNGQLPPLRETWYGRYSTAPRAMYFDIPLERGETSIIKRHPPRRLEILRYEGLGFQHMNGRGHNSTHNMPHSLSRLGPPVICCQILFKALVTVCNYQSDNYVSKSQPVVQMELKKSLHREERITKQNPRDHKVKKILQSIPGNEDDDLLTTLPDETMNRGPGNSQAAEFLDYQARNEYCHRKIGKMEAWLREQEARGQILWDISSSDSDEQGNDDKKPRALVRTRTERIPLFDAFFDAE
uniref:Uncharacterized protein n=1 Tax=Spermophilus dauricus TaxID=99837 RepID=A0A8C9Q402_SPEDA